MIEGYVGNVGSGKTYCMVARALRYVGKLPIFANMRVDWAIYFEDWEQMVGLSQAVILLDEAPQWFNARDWNTTPREVLNWLSQSRKHGCHLWFTAQSELMVEAHLRRLVAWYWRCRRWGPLVISECIEPMSGERMDKQVRWLTKTVWERYDTYEVVGYADGSGSGRGMGAPDAMSEAQKLLAACYVREAWPGFVRYRAAEVADLWRQGVCIYRRVPGKGFMDVSGRFGALAKQLESAGYLWGITAPLDEPALSFSGGRQREGISAGGTFVDGTF